MATKARVNNYTDSGKKEPVSNFGSSFMAFFAPVSGDHPKAKAEQGAAEERQPLLAGGSNRISQRPAVARAQKVIEISKLLTAARENLASYQGKLDALSISLSIGDPLSQHFAQGVSRQGELEAAIETTQLAITMQEKFIRDNVPEGLWHTYGVGKQTEALSAHAVARQVPAGPA